MRAGHVTPLTLCCRPVECEAEQLLADLTLISHLTISLSLSLTLKLTQEVFSLLLNTCKNLGLTYVPTNDDVKKWIQQVDLNSDGKISLLEFEAFVIKCMEKTGYKTE